MPTHTRNLKLYHRLSTTIQHQHLRNYFPNFLPSVFCFDIYISSLRKLLQNFVMLVWHGCALWTTGIIPTGDSSYHWCIRCMWVFSATHFSTMTDKCIVFFSSFFCDNLLLIVVCHFVLFLLAIMLSVLLRYTDSDCPFGIFKLFLLLLNDQIFLLENVGHFCVSGTCCCKQTRLD